MSNAGESRGERRRRERIDDKARKIMTGAPPAPQASDSPQRLREFLQAIESWKNQIAPRLQKDQELAQRVNELLQEHLGVTSEDADRETEKPETDALHDSLMGPPSVEPTEYARQLLHAGGWTDRALADRYTQVCRQHHQRMTVGWRVGGEIVCAMRRPASTRIEVWVKGERGDEEPQHFIGPGDFN